MKFTLSVAVTVIMVATPQLAVAQASQDRLRDVLTVGRMVSIVDDGGDRREGRITETTDGLVKIARRGGDLQVPISRIVLVEKPDSVRNGAFTGLGIGLGIGAMSIAVSGGRNVPDGIAATSLITTGLMCMGIGTAFDAMFDHRRTLYSRNPVVPLRVAPMVGRGSAGISVGFQW